MENLDKKTQKKLLNIAEIHQNGPIAVIKKIIEFDDTLEDGIEKIGETIEKVGEKITELTEKVDSKLSEVKDGENYILTDEDKQEIVSLIEVPKPIKGDKGEKGKDGKNGKDGKTPDTEELILQVLSEIELPEYKETILDNGEEIVAKINELSTEDEAYKIDASHIKNLPKQTKGFGGRSIVYTDNTTITGDGTASNPLISVGGGGSSLTVQDIDGNPTATNVNTIKFTNGSVTDDGAGVVTVTTGSGGGGDVSSSVGASVDSEVVIFDGTGGKTIKRATGTGIAKLTSGVLSAITPGTGIETWLATPSSANLLAAITDETGTGALVFGTSPTLVTPNLGTPSTLVGTNITGTASGLSIGGNAATVTVADAGGDTTTFPMLATSATGSLAPATDAGLTYNATTNALTTTTFIGALTGNADTATSATSASTATTLTGLTSSVAELNILDGVTATATELNYVDGVTSAIQTQIDAKANSAGALTQFVGNNTWKVWYSDASGDVQELALGADGTFLKSNGAALAPSFATPAGSGDVSKVGTPANNQIGVWTGDGTIEGDANLTFDTATDLLSTVNATLTGELTLPNTGLHLLDTNGTHDLIVAPGSNLTADRTLTLTTGDTNMILDLTAVTDEYVLAYDSSTNTWRGVVASGGGSGITRSINNVSGTTSAGATASTDYVYNATSGTFTITLPTAVSNTNMYIIKNSGTGIVTVATTSAQTIDGATTQVIPTQYTSISMVSDGSNWILLDN